MITDRSSKFNSLLCLFSGTLTEEPEEETPLVSEKRTTCQERPVNALPLWLSTRFHKLFAVSLGVFFAILSVVAIVFYFYGYFVLGVTD